ncbi:uncharacterized protein BX663DRAFT_501966 [Cokeromyces recurvatus]|uniref:uncharacterized protein n=1 Tax=Cokeromyces recurvatus TaxID=90255 RepID=UPI00221F7867|nr:uncharacterized protein BX663DRAFT_501966 [Cokeromyces recurvatus]KAI7905174.1 hypothetical protein BX663DRAFT_501966 [Cokeromyces recurvatus]
MIKHINNMTICAKCSVYLYRICINENRVPLHVHHLNCLNTKNGWLNDTVINYALDMLKDKYNNTQMYISSTFFFTRLQQAAANASENYYEILKKWFRKVHLFNKSLWLIPVFQKSHWFLMAVTSLQNKKHFSIVCMDSLGKDRTECLQLLEKFIARKYKDDRINGEWHPPKLLTAKIPRQTNGNDCGLHLIRSAELLLSNKKKTIQLAMGKLDKEKTKKLFERVMIRNRQQLKKDILEYTKSINKKQ